MGLPLGRWSWDGPQDRLSRPATGRGTADSKSRTFCAKPRDEEGNVRQGATTIDVSPEVLYDLVSDVRRMGEWSPECQRCEWIDGATGPAVGARFKGSNAHGRARWSTTTKVVAAESGREFAFVTGHLGRDMTKWSYQFEPASDGRSSPNRSRCSRPAVVLPAERSLPHGSQRPARRPRKEHGQDAATPEGGSRARGPVHLNLGPRPTGFEPAASALTGRRANQTALRDQATRP